MYSHTLTSLHWRSNTDKNRYQIDGDKTPTIQPPSQNSIASTGLSDCIMLTQAYACTDESQYSAIGPVTLQCHANGI